MKRIVPRDDPIIVEHYADLMKTQPNHAVVIEDDDGTYRFQGDPLIRDLVTTKRVDLNQMCIDFQRGLLPLESYMAFYRGLGYSLSGFVEVFGDHLWPDGKDS